MLACLSAFVSAQAEIPIQWSLLAEPAVQRELKLSRFEVERIQGIWTRSEAAVKQKLDSGEARRATISSWGMTMQAATPGLQRLGQSLPPNQKRRAREISIQQCKTDPVSYPGVAETLQVTSEQLSRISKHRQQVLDNYQQRIERYAGNHRVPRIPMKGGMSQPTRTPAILKLEADRDKRVQSALHQDLTKQQVAKLKSLLGKPFLR